MKARIILSFVILSVLISSQSLIANEIDPIPIPLNLDRRNSTTKINMIVDPSVFTNSSFTIEDVLSETNGLEFKPGNIAYAGTYEFDTNISQLESVEREEITSFLLSIENSSNHSGYEINSTAIDQGLANSTFTPINGSSFDAEVTLNWIRDNLWDQDASKYTFYFFNFEDLDINNQSHWFNVKPQDVDTGEFGNKFFSGTSGLEAGKQVSAWGGRSGLPIHFIDISSVTWYGDFINQVWPSNYQGNSIRKSVNDFPNRSSITYLHWLRDMIVPFYKNSFSNDVFTPIILQNSVDITKNPVYHVPSVVFLDDEEKLTTDNWIISENTMSEILSVSFPFLDFNVTTHWALLSEFEDIEAELNSHIQTDSNGQKFVELSNGFLEYLELNQLNSIFGNMGANTIPSLIFYLDDIEFRWSGLAIAGLGGMGWQLQIVSEDRLYNEDGTKERGFSQVLLHEIGHSMGLPHPFYTFNGWSSDFAASIMGYYTSYPDFSIYSRDAIARLYADYFIIQANYLNSVADDERDIINGAQKLLLAEQAYENREYSEAVKLARNSIHHYQSIFLPETSTTTNSETSLLFNTILIGILVLGRIKNRDSNVRFFEHV